MRLIYITRNLFQISYYISKILKNDYNYTVADKCVDIESTRHIFALYQLDKTDCIISDMQYIIMTNIDKFTGTKVTETQNYFYLSISVFDMFTLANLNSNNKFISEIRLRLSKILNTHDNSISSDYTSDWAVTSKLYYRPKLDIQILSDIRYIVTDYNYILNTTELGIEDLNNISHITARLNIPIYKAHRLSNMYKNVYYNGSSTYYDRDICENLDVPMSTFQINAISCKPISCDDSLFTTSYDTMIAFLDKFKRVFKKDDQHKLSLMCSHTDVIASISFNDINTSMNDSVIDIKHYLFSTDTAIRKILTKRG